MYNMYYVICISTCGGHLMCCTRACVQHGYVSRTVKLNNLKITKWLRLKEMSTLLARYHALSSFVSKTQRNYLVTIVLVE